MKKIVLLVSLITSLSSFAFGSAVVRVGATFNVGHIDSETWGFYPYFRLEGEYQLPIIAINDKLIFSIGTGAATNIGGTKKNYPMYYTAYINPTLDYKINEDLIFKTGLSFGVGADLKIDNMSEKYMLSFTSPILGTFDIQYKNISASLKLGTRITTDKTLASYNGSLTLGYSFEL